MALSTARGASLHFLDLRHNPRAYTNLHRGPITQDCNGLPLRSEMLPAIFAVNRCEG